MIAKRGLTLVELDHQASSADALYGMITADCLNPKEIDDGIFVEPLPAAQETYKVGICVADTSSLYHDAAIFDQAMENTEAKYWEEPDGSMGYESMIDLDAVRSLEFTAGNVRDALVVTFIVGCQTPPSEVEIGFGKVEVVKNQDYIELLRDCMPGAPGERFGRASAFILRHLRYTSDSYRNRVMPQTFKKIYKRMLVGEDLTSLERGSRINEAFMIAANHLVGKTLADEGTPAIYRVHDPRKYKHDEVIPRDLARYSVRPDPHVGLNITPYCRVTSPLRRLEDFVMSYQLRQRYEGAASGVGEPVITEAIERLNARIARLAAQGAEIPTSETEELKDLSLAHARFNAATA